MWNNISIWIGNKYQRIINSIAFFPALIGFIFLLISYFCISFDFSETGRAIKAQLSWLSLKDATTARSIISAIAAGLISLTVFSFSMVMIVLSQTASQMSNRILDRLIGNRFQQIVLGFYVGTIVFALFLLTTVRDIDSGLYIPALSTYLLILITVVDIFLFIYFLHYVTQSVKSEVIIQRIYEDTKERMKKVCTLKTDPGHIILETGENQIRASRAGIYQGFNVNSLLKICTENNCRIQAVILPGIFVFHKTVVAECSIPVEDKIMKQISNTFYINNSETIEQNYSYGFRQLMEVGIKALSPGINDPGTAVQALRALSKLIAFRINNLPNNAITDKRKEIRIITAERTVEDLVRLTFLPIWDYGKEDRMIQNEFIHLVKHLKQMSAIGILQNLYEEASDALKENQL